MTSNPSYRARYQAAYEDLVRTHKYHFLTRNQKIMVPGHVNHSDDELAFLSFYPLLRYETDPGARRIYRKAWTELADRAARAKPAVERDLRRGHWGGRVR